MCRDIIQINLILQRKGERNSQVMTLDSDPLANSLVCLLEVADKNLLLSPKNYKEHQAKEHSVAFLTLFIFLQNSLITFRINDLYFSTITSSLKNYDFNRRYSYEMTKYNNNSCQGWKWV